VNTEEIKIGPGKWTNGPLPAGVTAGQGTLITGPKAFGRYKAEDADALRIGEMCTMDGVHFAVGRKGRMTIGDGCAFYGSLLLCDHEIHIGRFVVMGWNVVISDSDLHPTEPAERQLDVLACSPLGAGLPRRPYVSKTVRIGNDVYIGHAATLLKGVSIGDGAWIEPGTMVTRDVPPGMRVIGNPSQVIGPAGDDE
jgi:acetyltransferase-like isoleucine patch superfamily enzyme